MERPLPPAPVVSITESNRPLGIFAGSAFNIILPDGSLWRWDALYSPNSDADSVRPAMPVRVGAGCEWLQIGGTDFRNLLLRSDGTIWRWWGGGPIPVGTMAGGAGVPSLGGNAGASGGPVPVPVDGSHDWASISTRLGYSVAIKKDGTLWGWDDNSHTVSSSGRGRNPGILQVGTNSDWIAAACLGTATFGVRADGTLWIWGIVGRPGAGRATFPSPVQFCQETNWTALGFGFGFLVWNSAGEVWEPNLSSASALASASATCQFISSNAPPGHLAGAYCPTPKLYEARRDGTLWERHYALRGWPVPPDLEWRRVGKRTDWVALWGHGGTAVGLTADNTLWTWGIDPSRDAPQSLAARFQRLKVRISDRLGTRMPPSMQLLPIQIAPRPLLRMVFPGPTNTINPAK